MKIFIISKILHIGDLSELATSFCNYTKQSAKSVLATNSNLLLLIGIRTSELGVYPKVYTVQWLLWQCNDVICVYGSLTFNPPHRYIIIISAKYSRRMGLPHINDWWICLDPSWLWVMLHQPPPDGKVKFLEFWAKIAKWLVSEYW